MDKLFKMFEAGEMPNFLQVMEAISDLADYWPDKQGHVQQARQATNADRPAPEYPVFCSRRVCENCG